MLQEQAYMFTHCIPLETHPSSVMNATIASITNALHCQPVNSHPRWIFQLDG